MPLTIGDDWSGAWDEVPWARPDDWRAVAEQLAWDVAVIGAGWPFLEAAHQRPEDQRSVVARLDALAEVIAADLPFLLGVGPTSPNTADQPQLPLLLPDEPPLERLDERPGELSWRMYFWMVLEQTLDQALDRATPALRLLALADRGIAPDVAAAALADGEALALIAPTFPDGVTVVEVERWWHDRAATDRRLGRALAEQVALQVELLLREQLPTVLPLLEEAIAVGVEDAALGGAVHVESHREQPVSLRLVSYEGATRAPVWLAADADATLRQLVAAAGRTIPEVARAATSNRR